MPRTKPAPQSNGKSIDPSRRSAARQRRDPTRLSRGHAAVRTVPSASPVPDGAIELRALARTCEALQVAPRSNPHAEAADRRTLARAQERGLIKDPASLARYRASRFTELTASAYPEASAAVLYVANDWHYWLWSFDDRTDVKGEDLAVDLARHERVVAALLSLLLNGKLPEAPEAADPNVLFLAQILSDLRIVAPVPCVDRFREAVRAYLVRGSLAGAQNWAVGHTPDPKTFLAQRIHEGAYDTVLPFIELAAGCAGTDPVFTSLAARRAALLSNRIVVVSNDIFSYEKEVTLNGNPNNLLHAIELHEHRSFRDSYLRVVSMIESWTAELLEIEARSDGALRRYIRGNYDWIAASYHWHFKTGRYSSPTSPFRELNRV